MRPTRPLLFCLFLLFLGGKLYAQSCSIRSDSIVCLGDFIGFDAVVSGGTVTGYDWDFDENQSSSQSSPFVKYATPGSKTIKLTVQLAGGGTCNATKKIFVHPLPNARFGMLPSSIFCLLRNNICFMDSSSPGASGSAIVKRIILFGDGGADISNNPTANKTVCHKYAGTGTYTVTMEITDAKGCQNIVQRTVTILPDFAPVFGYQINKGCDTVEACLYNVTKIDTADVASFTWRFGDGTTNTTDWAFICHKYGTPGTFSVTLIVTAKNGCTDSFTQNNLVKVNPIVFQIVKDRYTDCMDGNGFTFEDKGPKKDKYFWYERDSTELISAPGDETNPYTLHFASPGKKYISLTAHLGNCIKTFAFDSVEVLGPLAGISGRNTSLCSPGDSTYFCETSIYYKSYHIKRLWDLGDKYCLPCTTDTRNGINVGSNCRYSRDVNPIHLYTKEDCYSVMLTLEDTVTGCVSVANSSVIVGAPDVKRLNFRVTNQKPCTGYGAERTFFFSPGHGCHKYYINPDSASPTPTGFLPMLAQYNYLFRNNESRLVTIGIVLEAGPDSIVNCPGYTTSYQKCYDTMWYHHYYEVTPEPAPAFSLDRTHGCSPLEVTATLLDSIQYDVSRMYVHWGDSTLDSVLFAPGDSIMPAMSHRYTRPGMYTAVISMYNTLECDASATTSIIAGHYTDVLFDPLICPGQVAYFLDSVSYFGDSLDYWHFPDRIAAGKELMFWNFGDGSATKTGYNPYHVFQAPGIYKATLATKDSIGCIDTFHFDIRVGGVKAAIRQPRAAFLCSEILQLFDSSYLIDSLPGDQVVRWYWDFGDGKTPSYLQNPWHYYSTNGEFTITLIVMNTRACVDTVRTTIKIEGPEPLFEFVTDSIGCVPYTVELKNISRNVKNWIWYFGDPDHTNLPVLADSNVRFTYTTPGTYYLYLYGADSINNPNTGNRQFCSSIWPDSTANQPIVKKVVVLPIPPADFAIPPKVCKDVPFLFYDQSDPKYKKYLWYMGDGDSVSSISRLNTYTYHNTGNYLIRYQPSYVPGPMDRACFDTTSKTIEVVDVTADFEIDMAASRASTIQFRNTSSQAVRYEWHFGQPSSPRNTSTLEHPDHNFHPDTGYFNVCLVAYNDIGCKDSICKPVYTNYLTHLRIPNVFTPGDVDGFNDDFDIDIEGEESYHTQIFNRWGALVYESKVDGYPGDGVNWDGTFMNNRTEKCPDGSYYLVFKYNFFYSDTVRYTGTVKLIRE